ncbi:MAG: hypothetical protein HQL44_15705 [Alphaproteobacteria bacterium]|nr:hypothetical protein [Alphaproteobacteria bacterium]
MKRDLFALSLLGLAALATPSYACGGNADLNPGEPAFAPSSKLVNQEHLLNVSFTHISPLLKLQAGKSGYVRLGFLSPDDKWEIRHSTERNWNDILKPVENEYMSLRGTRDGNVITLFVSGKAEGQSSFHLAYLPQKGSPAYGPSKRLIPMPIIVKVLAPYVFVPKVMVVEGDVDASKASVDGYSSFFARLPPAMAGHQWEVADAMQTSSDPSADKQGPWQPLEVAPRKMENGDFHIGTPSYGTIKIVFAMKDGGTGIATSKLTLALRVNPRPKC